MRRISLSLIVAFLVLLPGRGAAVIGAADSVPSATLLLPYFEVDLKNPEGINTLFSINNAASTAVLTQVTVWSDQAVPVLNFNLYLTGYDVQTISMRDILVGGKVPVTATDGQDPTDSISPQGSLSEDINFASCTNMPIVVPAISTAFRAHLQAWLTGKISPETHNCAGADINTGTNQIARGYVTVDTVNACGIIFPSSWSSYKPFLTDQNVLWGDWYMINTGQSFAHGDMLVHVEACPTCFAAGDHTFYGRYNAGSAADGREPLPTTWAARYVNGGAFTGGTDLIVWREAGSTSAPYHCSLAGPSWHPLDAASILIFDEQEQPVLSEICPIPCDSIIFVPQATQRADVATDLLTPFDFGWVYLSLQHDEVLFVYGDDDAQSWVTAILDASGKYSVGFDPLHLDANANAAVTPLTEP